nr:hypothetical protein GCM10020093_067330 [Planobispora longispora]
MAAFARPLRRAHRPRAGGPEGPTLARIAEALPDQGVVLDVGAGTGAASLPLARLGRGDGPGGSGVTDGPGAPARGAGPGPSAS